MVEGYRERRDVLVSALQAAGFVCTTPQGAYYVLADFSGISDEDDTTFAKRLTSEGGVAPVPGSSFYSTPEGGRSVVRFVFCKRLDTLHAAAERLKTFTAPV